MMTQKQGADVTRHAPAGPEMSASDLLQSTEDTTSCDGEGVQVLREGSTSPKELAPARSDLIPTPSSPVQPSTPMQSAQSGVKPAWTPSQDPEISTFLASNTVGTSPTSIQVTDESQHKRCGRPAVVFACLSRRTLTSSLAPRRPLGELVNGQANRPKHDATPKKAKIRIVPASPALQKEDSSVSHLCKEDSGVVQPPVVLERGIQHGPSECSPMRLLSAQELKTLKSGKLLASLVQVRAEKVNIEKDFLMHLEEEAVATREETPSREDDEALTDVSAEGSHAMGATQASQDTKSPQQEESKRTTPSVVPEFKLPLEATEPEPCASLISQRSPTAGETLTGLSADEAAFTAIKAKSEATEGLVQVQEEEEEGEQEEKVLLPSSRSLANRTPRGTPRTARDTPRRQRCASPIRSGLMTPGDAEIMFRHTLRSRRSPERARNTARHQTRGGSSVQCGGAEKHPPRESQGDQQDGQGRRERNVVPEPDPVAVVRRNFGKARRMLRQASSPAPATNAEAGLAAAAASEQGPALGEVPVQSVKVGVTCKGDPASRRPALGDVTNWDPILMDKTLLHMAIPRASSRPKARQARSGADERQDRAASPVYTRRAPRLPSLSLF